jgi:hypothetical protein
MTRVDDREKAAADALRSTIVRIDPAAGRPDGFWGTFYWDVCNGDFAAEDLLSSGIARPQLHQG